MSGSTTVEEAKNFFASQASVQILFSKETSTEE
jgi:hypothetical protein